MRTAVGNVCFSSKDGSEIHPSNSEWFFKKNVIRQHFCRSVMFTSVLGFIVKQFCGERGQADCLFHSVFNWSEMCSSHMESLSHQ